MIDRNDVINTLKEKLYKQPYVNALWLEGADANNAVDEYSDLDFYLDINDESETDAIILVEKILNELSEIDYKYVNHLEHPKLRQKIYHLKETSPYLMIDFCWQLHSRDKKESCFIKENKVERPLILFDKAGVISFRDFDINEFDSKNKKRFNECIYYYTQHDRVMKYVRRGHYLEAYAYYNRYVLEPIINMLRIIYTPANSDYYLIHISDHIPKEYVKKLEFIAQISSLNDIADKIIQAENWFDCLSKETDRKYGYMK